MPLAFASAEFQTLPYRVHTPAASAGSSLPLIVFLHGVGERGGDNQAQLTYGFFGNDQSLFGSATARNYPAHILAPQAPAHDKWVAAASWAAPLRTAPAPTAALALTLQLVTQYCAAHGIDRQRLYLTGLSMGGFGVCDLIARSPATFAAGIVVCGAGDTARAKELSQVPLYILHGTADKAVPLAQATRLEEAVRQAGGSAHLHRYHGAGHAVWDQAFAEPTVINWLFAQRRR